MSIIKYVKGGFSILRQQGQVARPLKSCLFTCPHCILAWNVLSPPFSKADPPFGLSSSLTPIWNHYWLLDPPPSFWSNVPIFLLSAWVGVPGSSSPSWLYLTWLQGVFCLDLPFPWVVGVFFLPRVSHIHQTHALGKPPITWHSLWNTTCLLLLQSQPGFWTLPVVYWPQLKTLKSVIRHQILPLPFYLKVHLSICSTLIRPQDF